MKLVLYIRQEEKETLELKEDGLFEDRQKAIHAGCEYLKYKFRQTMEITDKWEIILTVESKINQLINEEI